MNKQGKTLTIFLCVISVLLLSLTVIAIFFYKTENEARKDLEKKYAEAKALEEQLEKEKKDLKKQVYVMEEKTKESDEKLSATMDDLDLEKGLREEMKKDNDTLKEQVDIERQSNETLRKEVIDSQKRIDAIKDELEKAKSACVPTTPDTQSSLPSSPDPGVAVMEQLDQIATGVTVTDPSATAGQDGRVLSVNAENNFVVFDRGSSDGISEGMTLSIVRDNRVLGEVTVSRVQTKMSVADVVAPLKIQDIQENDQVVMKK